jgi:diamine N-acetyltransferase
MRLTTSERETMMIIKGSKINLIPAPLSDRPKIYEWCFHSETTKSHSGPPDYPDILIPTYEEFAQDHEDYFFTGSRPEDGRGFLIVADGEAVGFISYTAFHLKPGIAELDNWMHSEAHCGKGYGSDAIRTLGNYLHETMGFHTFIMGPALSNTRALRAYEKAGLTKTDQLMSEFLLPEYVSLYGGGDYGVDRTAVYIKRFRKEGGESL